MNEALTKTINEMVDIAVNVIARMYLAGAKKEHVENAIGAMYEGFKDMAGGYTLTMFIKDILVKVATV